MIFIKGKVNPKVLCPWETGRQILSLPEAEFLSRIISKKMGEKAAKDFYLSLWKLFIDSRNRDRKAKMRPLNSRFRKSKSLSLLRTKMRTKILLVLEMAALRLEIVKNFP